MQIAGTTILVTGGSSGLGAGCVRRFAAQGAQVVAVARPHHGAMLTESDRVSIAVAGGVNDFETGQGRETSRGDKLACNAWAGERWQVPPQACRRYQA